jgi:dihydroceramidase
VAEPINTFSNLSFVIFGLMGAIHEVLQKSRSSYVLLHSTIALIGVGSILFHGTLTAWGQQADELPMVWHLLLAIYCVNRDAVGTSSVNKSIAASALLVYAVVFSVLHFKLKTTTAFQVHFATLLGALLLRMYYRFRNIDVGESGRAVVNQFFASGLTAFACWLIDYHGCPIVCSLPINPQGHMWWHILMGYAAFCSVVMFRMLESAEAGKPLELKYFMGLPFPCKVKAAGSDIESQKGETLLSLLPGGQDLF